jgi:hypothetical protein
MGAETNHDPWVRCVYDRLRVLQPHIELGGVWQNAGRYYIVCQDLAHNARRSL